MRSPSPFPDDKMCLVAPRGGGAYGLRLERVVPLAADGPGGGAASASSSNATQAPPAANPQGTRQWLKAERLVEHELPPAEKIPEDALAAALRCGFVSNAAVADALDSTGRASVCLCCFRVHGARRARALVRQLQLIQRYYAEEAYMRSGAMYRNLRALISDVPREAQHQIKAFVGVLDATPAAVREANRWPGLCFAAPECGQARILWVYSTARGRRFLRKLGKRCRSPAFGFSVQITVAVADPGVVPRFWHKMYVARLGDARTAEAFEGGAGGAGDTVTPAMVAAFWALVATTAEQVGDRKKQEKKSFDT
jgi:hypothetical protein